MRSQREDRGRQGFSLGKVDGTKSGIEIEIKGSGGAGLAILKSGELFGVAEEELNGLITNDKFCLTRCSNLTLKWWRRPLRLRQPKGSG